MTSPGAPEDTESHSDEHSSDIPGVVVVIESDKAPWAAPRVLAGRFRNCQDFPLSSLCSSFFFFDFLADAKSLTALATAVANSSALLLLRADDGREPLEFDRVRVLEERGRGSLPGRGDFLALPGAARPLP